MGPIILGVHISIREMAINQTTAWTPSKDSDGPCVVRISVNRSCYHYCYRISNQWRGGGPRPHLADVLFPAIPVPYALLFFALAERLRGILRSSFIHSKLAIIMRISLMSLNIILASTRS